MNMESVCKTHLSFILFLVQRSTRQWVVFGQRGVDEMSHLWLGITYLSEDQFDRLTAERNARLTAASGE